MLANGHSSEEAQQKEIVPLVVDHVCKEGTQDGKDVDYSRDHNATVGLQGHLGAKNNERGYNVIGGDDRRRGDGARSYANGRGSYGGGYGNGINGRGGRQSYDQVGYYHPTRNNYEQRGGGRDVRGGNSYSRGNSHDIGNAYNGYDNVQLAKGTSA